MVLWLYSLWVVIADYVREHTFVEFCTLGECLLLYENCNSKGKKKAFVPKKDIQKALFPALMSL